MPYLYCQSCRLTLHHSQLPERAAVSPGRGLEQLRPDAGLMNARLAPILPGGAGRASQVA